MTYNSKTQDVTLALLRGAILGEDERLPFDVGHIDADTWKEVMELSITQGVAALCYDSLEKMQCECLPPKDILLTWFGLTMQVERSNKEYVQKVESITNALHDNGVRVVVLKGLACSRWYHRPEHRTYGDFDCFLCGDFNKGNKVMQAMGGRMEPCYYKHSEVFFKGLMVENHRYLLNIRGSRNNKNLERHLQRLIIERPVGEREFVEGTTIEIPCADVNALFLMVHMFTHFLDEGTNLRQLSDWAVFLKRNQGKVDWLSFYHWTDRLHLSRFAEAVTFIAASHLGVSITNSNIRQDGTYAKRILDDALWESEKVHNKQLTHSQLLLTLSSNFFRSQWKYNEIYQRSALLELLNAGWSWIFERNPKLLTSKQIQYMVKITIITVTFNRAHVIRDAIEGVLRQKYKNYEYIIVDGASKDNTLNILKEYEPKFEGRMRWISEPDKGLYDAINKGIRMATGDVVGIINSDDFFHRDDTFDVIAEAFEDSNTDAIYTDDEEINEKTGKRFRFNGGNFKTWQYRIGMMPSHPTFYAKKELFEKYGYYKLGYKIAADFELMMRFAYVNKVKMKYVPEAIMTFRLGGVSTNLKNKMLLNKETVRALRENGLFACAPMIWIKYLFKINQIIHSI